MGVAGREWNGDFPLTAECAAMKDEDNQYSTTRLGQWQTAL